MKAYFGIASAVIVMAACYGPASPATPEAETDAGAALPAPESPPASPVDSGPAQANVEDASVAPRDAGTAPPTTTCATATPPRDGLALWLRAGVGVTLEGDRVTSWADQSGGPPALPPSAGQRPTRVVGALAGKAILHFEGGREALQRTTPIDGLHGLTIAFVNATPTLWKDDQNEWCHHAACDPKAGAGARVVSETGCSGTYEHVLWWNGQADWTGVYLSPKQEEVAFRFGNGTKTYSENPCSVPHDVQVAFPRASSLHTAFSLTVAIHDELENRIYVQGEEALRIPSPGGKEGAVHAGDRLDIGNGFGWVEGTNHGGDVAEVLVYKRALADAERHALEAYVGCNLFPSDTKLAGGVR